MIYIFEFFKILEKDIQIVKHKLDEIRKIVDVSLQEIKYFGPLKLQYCISKQMFSKVLMINNSFRKGYVWKYCQVIIKFYEKKNIQFNSF